jgi:hypothetical protein
MIHPLAAIGLVGARVDVVEIDPIWAFALVDADLAIGLQILEHHLDIAVRHPAFAGECRDGGPGPAIIVGVIGQGDEEEESRALLA